MAEVVGGCGNCMFFVVHDKSPTAGECHRYPRAELKTKNDWCGEFCDKRDEKLNRIVEQVRRS